MTFKVIIAILLALAAAVLAADPTFTLTAYRALQLDRKLPSGESTRIGSQASTFRGPVALASPPRHAGSWKGAIAVISELTESSPQDIQRLISGGVAGLWFVAVNYTDVRLAAIDSYLTETEISVPVYFTSTGSAEAFELLRELEGASEMLAMTEKSLKAPAATGPVQSSILHATIATASKKSKSEVPTLLLSSSVDTLGAIPAVATGDISGVAAVMDLFRIFSKQTTSSATTTDFNLQFLVTNSGHLNFAGTKAWMAQRRGDELDALNFALCVDSLTDGTTDNKMYLHASKQFADSTVASTIVALAVAEGKARGIEVEVITTKLDPSRAEVGFEHEIFAHKKVPALTVSAFAHAAPQVLRYSSTAHRSASVHDVAIVAQRVAWLKALVAGVLELDAATFTSQSEQVIGGWLEFGHRHSRPYYDAVAMTSIETAFRGKASSGRAAGVGFKILVNVTSVTTPTGSMTLYGPSEAKVQVYRTKSTLFELGLTAAIFAFTIVFSIVTVGVSSLRKMVGLGGK